MLHLHSVTTNLSYLVTLEIKYLGRSYITIIGGKYMATYYKKTLPKKFYFSKHHIPTYCTFRQMHRYVNKYTLGG